ncbi:hypothetical protein [Candidatus Mycoplasma haematominutum]|uniref:Uncharacterized protein n=1 Tax=Candidatus Mycoplasma haematominutum 'Birmingham 1' TaxID=1116213 RepID=G8C3G4_9MOLU|nr:hypothetical protein [Candidatus Mycoplasma haematominutum]CCE66862.1 hypothetical protein MHM_03440 [Candidatus Mycoplasma haematominutum 'Birmingham 1']
MSFPLAKLITSGVLGLNTSGLALYFGLQLFEGASTSPLFDSSSSSNLVSEGKALKKFIDGEKLIIEKINAEISKFIETLKALTTEKTQEYSKIREFFEKVSSTEQELKTFYDSNREILEEIGKLGKYEHDVSAKKLEAEESAKRLEFLKESLKKVSGVMHGWGVSVQELICALENAAENNCRSKANSWFSSNSSGSTSNLTGGGRRQFKSRNRLRSSQKTATRFQRRVRARASKTQKRVLN